MANSHPPGANSRWRQVVLRSVLKGIDATSDWSGKLVAFLIYAGIGVLVYEVVLRYLFNAPTIWAHGVAQRLFAAYAILLGAYTLRQGGHIKVDILYNRFSIRTRAILDLATATLFLLFCGVLVWKGGIFAWTSVMMEERCNTPFNAILYPVKAMLPLGALLILLQGLAEFTRNLITAVTGSAK